MKLAIIGASGNTGIALVQAALARGHQVSALCRSASAEKLADFRSRPGFSLFTAAAVTDTGVLQQALQEADAALVILITVHELKATDLIDALGRASAATGCRRFVFTAGEITAVPAAGEREARRQRWMLRLFSLLVALTPYSLRDVRDASRQIQQHDDWDWTIIRAPTLIDAAPIGYRLDTLDAVSSRDQLPRTDYADCLLDAIAEPRHHQRLLTVRPAALHCRRRRPCTSAARPTIAKLEDTPDEER